jgi:flagellar hook-associated protein FlgK
VNTVANIATSGMAAAQARLDAAASNIANLPTEGYRRVQARAEAEPSGGVRTRTERLPEPGSDVAADQVEQRMAAGAFVANLKVFQAADRMLGRLLDTDA